MTAKNTVPFVVRGSLPAIRQVSTRLGARRALERECPIRNGEDTFGVMCTTPTLHFFQETPLANAS